MCTKVHINRLCVHSGVCERRTEMHSSAEPFGFTSSQQWVRSVGKTMRDQLLFEIAACPTGILMTWSFISS